MQNDFVQFACFQRGHHFLPGTQVGKRFCNSLAISILVSSFLWFCEIQICIYTVACLACYHEKAIMHYNQLT